METLTKDVIGRWRDYVEQLFEDISTRFAPEINGELNGPEILREEVEQAVRGMQRDKIKRRR